jgi:fructokinase
MKDSIPRVVSFGEVLFDCIEGRACLGGAPLNFAWYLNQLAIPVAVLSAVGRDELGASVRRVLQRSGIISWVSDRPEPTGTVDVRVVEGQPEFDIHTNVAWEYIEFPHAVQEAPELVYFGTVAQGTELNCATLRKLLALQPRHVLFDVNLRPGFDFCEIVLEGLQRASILKVSAEEWTTISELLGLDAPAQALERFDLEMLALTRGGKGAEVHVPGRAYQTSAPRVEVVDSVGAGDAFCAALVAGVLQGIDLQRALEAAAEIAAFTVQRRGGQVELSAALCGIFA